MIVSQPCTFWK